MKTESILCDVRNEDLYLHNLDKRHLHSVRLRPEQACNNTRTLTEGNKTFLEVHKS